MAQSRGKSKRLRTRGTSPNGRNRAHRKKAREDTIGIPKWNVAWALKG
jgi:hypothetical protein